MIHRNILLASALALASATSLGAQSASYTVTGIACTTGRLTSALGAVPLAANGVPRIGTTLTITTECSASYPWGNRRQVFLLTGTSNSSAGGLPLPFDISSVRPGQTDCGLLQTSGEIVIRVVNEASYTTPAAIALDVPNLASLAGVTFYQQVLSFESTTFGSPFSSIALSALGTGVIGF